MSKLETCPEPELRYVEAQRVQDRTAVTIQMDDGGFCLVFRDRASMFEVSNMLELAAKFFRERSEQISQKRRYEAIEMFREKA